MERQKEKILEDEPPRSVVSNMLLGESREIASERRGLDKEEIMLSCGCAWW